MDIDVRKPQVSSSISKLAATHRNPVLPIDSIAISRTREYFRYEFADDKKGGQTSGTTEVGPVPNGTSSW